MDFILLTLGLVAFIVVVLVLLARAYPGSGAPRVLSKTRPGSRVRTSSR
jgi:hypothetical protein